MKKRELNVDLIPSIRRLQIGLKGRVATQIGGEYKSIFKGKGLVFADYRDYTLDDDASLIDWKATARSDRVLVREYEEERKLNVFFLVDVSSSMLFGSTKRLKNEYALELASSLAYVILNTGDKVGFAAFSEEATKKFLPEANKTQYYILTRNLIQADIYGGSFNFKNAINFLISFLKTKSLVFIVSDFLNLKNAWQEEIKVASKKHDIIALMIRDPIDETLPLEDMQVLISDPHSYRKMLINPLLIKERYEDYNRKQKKEMERIFIEASVDLVELKTSESFVKPIINLFKRRYEQWR